MEIIDYPNYSIYRDGRVWSKFGKGRFLKPYIAKQTGYYCYTLMGVKQTTTTLHSLLGKYYIENPNPDNYNMIDHIDRNKLNNDLNNLRWCDSTINNNNVGVFKTNKLGVKNISVDGKAFRFCKIYKGIIHRKSFKTLQEAIDYKRQYLTKFSTQ
tara:strand:+ start:1091 stop:1555 length:465 start_codon:yes stop_codon:yes gene_type:complete